MPQATNKDSLSTAGVSCSGLKFRKHVDYTHFAITIKDFADNGSEMEELVINV